MGQSLPFQCDLSGEQRRLIEWLWRDGFVRVPGLLTGADIAMLARECSRLMRDQPRVSSAETGRYGRRYRVPVYEDRDWSVLGNAIGLSVALDEGLERLFTHRDLAALLRAILGTGYKLWDLSIRRSESTDTGLRMHQDAKGEFGIAVLLQDVPGRGGGATAVIPGSHRYPLSAVDAGMRYINPKYLKPWARQLSGSAGDVVLFCKSIWHGRLPAGHAAAHDAILLSLFAAGHAFRPFDVPPDLLARLPPELRRLLDARTGTRSLENGYIRVEAEKPQAPRLIDALYAQPSRLHPAQLLRVLPPVLRAMLPIRRALRG